MAERLAEKIRQIAGLQTGNPVSGQFLERLEADPGLTRDENPQTHYCVYFAAYDPEAREVFIGHHKKSDLWLFNGGHIDEGEIPEEALEREIGEEWGLQMQAQSIGNPQLLTITEINNPTKQTCTRHYDIWYFVPVKKDAFAPDDELLSKEFHQTEWLNPDVARIKITDPSTLEAISRFEEIFNQHG
jgi:8-oxo-dGTP pyrophosphatase MutT (NUDIX family)